MITFNVCAGRCPRPRSTGRVRSVRVMDLPRVSNPGQGCVDPPPPSLALLSTSPPWCEKATHGRVFRPGECMNVSRRSQEDLGVNVSDGIRIGSIAIATYEYVASVTRQLLFM